MNANEFRAWMKRYGLSLTAAAGALGYTRKHIVNFRNGSTPLHGRTLLAIQRVTTELELERRPGTKNALAKANRLA